MMENELLTVRETARWLGLQESTIRKWILTRRLGTVRLGRSVRLRREEVEALVSKNYVAPVPHG